FHCVVRHILEKFHSGRFRPRLADPAMDGVFHTQPVEGAVRRIDLQHVRVGLGVLLADRPPAEAADRVRRRGADPALHQAALLRRVRRRSRDAATFATSPSSPMYRPTRSRKSWRPSRQTDARDRARTAGGRGTTKAKPNAPT